MGITHAFVNPKSDGGDATITRPSDWNASHLIPRAARVAISDATVGSTSTCTWASAPAQTSTLIALVTTVASKQNVSSISQTNVTWTSLRTAENSTSARVEIWKGVPSGTPGTTTTVTYAGSTNSHAACFEWPYSVSAIGTGSDNTGSAINARSGKITPTAGDLVVFVHGVANGTIDLRAYVSGYEFIGLNGLGGGFGYLGYCVAPNTAEAWANVLEQSNAAWVNTIATIT